MLCYHTPGDMPMTRAQMANLPKFPQLGPRHNPVPFHHFINDTIDTLDAEGFEVLADEYVVNAPQTRFFGVLEVRSKALEGEYIPKDFGFVVGLRGAHDQSIQRGLVAGSRVFVCSNLAFNGDVKITTKQTTFIGDRLPTMIRYAVEQLNPLFEADIHRVDRYKSADINLQQQDHLLMELIRRGALPATNLPTVLKELREPSFEEHKEHEGTVWYLFNALTQGLKPNGKNSNSFNTMETVATRTQQINRELSTFLGAPLKLAA